MTNLKKLTMFLYNLLKSLILQRKYAHYIVSFLHICSVLLIMFLQVLASQCVFLNIKKFEVKEHSYFFFNFIPRLREVLKVMRTLLFLSFSDGLSSFVSQDLFEKYNSF
jgi:hypothetical protein